MLYTPQTNGARHYCGPFAIATITGESFEAIYKRLRSDRSKHGRRNRDARGRLKPVRGTYTFEVVRVLGRFGFNATKLGLHGSKTLRQVCEDFAHLQCPLLINVTGHFMVLKQGMLCDTHTHEPIPWTEYRQLKLQAKQLWHVTPKRRRTPASSQLANVHPSGTCALTTAT